MKRREFIALIGGAAAAWPLAARAQQPAMPMIGFFHSASPGGYAFLCDHISQWSEGGRLHRGRNVAVECPRAEG